MAKKVEKRIDARLALFASKVNQGVKPSDAMRQAGYGDGTISHGATVYVEKARELGLLVDPAVIQDAVAIIEAALPDAAREIARVMLGGRPKHDGQLDWIKEGFDRTRGKPQTKTDITSGGQPIAGPPMVCRTARPDEVPDPAAVEQQG